MIDIYKLGEDFRFKKYDTWDNGKFSGPLSDLDIKEDEIKRRFNTSYYVTVDEKESKSDDKTTEKIEIDIRKL